MPLPYLLQTAKTKILFGHRVGYRHAIEAIEGYWQQWFHVKNVFMTLKDTPDDTLVLKRRTDARYGARLIGGAIRWNSLHSQLYKELIDAQCFCRSVSLQNRTYIK